MQVGIFDIFLALVPMAPILVSIDATFSRNQYQAKYPTVLKAQSCEHFPLPFIH